MKPPIVVLCGSTRFKDAFIAANRDESSAGKIVLSVCWFTHADGRLDDAVTAAFQRLHYAKIDLADEVLIVSQEDGYIGSSTFKEIRYAEATGKVVRWLHPAAEETYRAMAQGEETH